MQAKIFFTGEKLKLQKGTLRKRATFQRRNNIEAKSM